MGKLAKSAVNVFFILLFSKVLGMFKEITLASNFGTSYIVDAYSIVCTLPSILYAFFNSGLSMSYIPVYSRIVGEEERKNFFYNSVCVLTIISMLVACVVYGFSGIVVHLLAPGFSGDTFDLTVFFVQFIAVYYPIYTIFDLFCVQSSADEKFEFANFCNSVVINLILIMSIAIAGIFSPRILGYGYVISIIVPTILLGWKISTRGYCFRWRFFPKDKPFVLLVRTAIPAGLSFMVNQLNAVIDRMFSSGYGEGSVSSLGYAERLHLLPYSMIVSVVLGVCNPRMNKFFAEHDIERGIYYARISIYIALFISIPILLFLYNFSESIVSFLFERGKFDRNSVLMTSQCLIYYSIGIPFYSLRQVASNVLTANMKQNLVLKNTIVIVLLNVILDYFLAKELGYSGLALATSITGIIAVFLMVYDLFRMEILLFDKDICKDLAKILICASASLILAIFLQKVIYLHCSNSWLPFITTSVAMIVIYLMLSALSKEKVLLLFWRHARSRFLVLF